MLKWDQPEIIDGVTVYRDDRDRTLFYLIPSQPRFRIDTATGLPVFRFLKYRFPIDRPDGRKGGGFVIFDTEFAVAEPQQAAIREQLTERLQEEWRRARREGTAPQAKIGQLSFLRGTASLQFLDSGGALVEKIQNPGAPSLYGNMITPFTVEMSPEGATLAEAALQDLGGVVQVAYDLWTPVKLPPVTARVWFNASKFMHFHQEIDVEERFWQEDDFKETVRETFIQTDAGGVEIDPGTVTDEKVLGAVRDWAWRSLEDAVTRMVLGDIPEVSPEEARKLYTEQDIENISIDVLRTRVASFSRRYTEGHVMEWNPAPRGTLPNITTLKDRDGNPLRWADFARTVDLNDPFFRQLEVTTRANADFSALPIDSVEVKLEYQQGNEHSVDEFSLRSADDVGKFRTFIANDSYKYHYSYQVNYDNASRRFESPVMETDERFLTINVGDIGVLLVDVSPGDLNFTQVREAQVTLQYEDADHGVPLIEQVFRLDDQNREHRWVRAIFQPRDEPYRYRVKYFMADGKEYQSDWQESHSPRLFLNDPFSASRTVNLRGFGDFQNRIDTIFLDLEYEDADNDYRQTHSAALNAGNTFDDWTFPVIQETGGRLRYTAHIRFKDGTVETVTATDVTDNTIMVGDVLLTQEIQVMADLVDFATVRLVRVTLDYQDAANGIADRADLVFKNGAPSTQPWRFGHKDRTKVGYQWSASYFLADGSVADIPPTSTEARILVLPDQAA